MVTDQGNGDTILESYHVELQDLLVDLDLLFEDPTNRSKGTKTKEWWKKCCTMTKEDSGRGSPNPFISLDMPIRL